jgi:hypothetical protein
MKRTWYSIAVPAVLLFWAAIGMAYPSGAPASRSRAAAIGSAAAEASCSACHASFAENSGGSVSLLGVPALFHGGQTYRLTVHLASTQTAGFGWRNWGFQMTAVDAATGLGAGTLSAVSPSETGIASGSGSFSTRRYVNQSSGGTKSGAASPVEWLVDWTAPASGATRIQFFVVGLAGNGSSCVVGDWVYTGSATSTNNVTPVIPTTWGAVKASYEK